MFKSNKKIITYLMFSLVLAIAIVFISDKPRHILPTSSMPVSEHTIVLDAGHGLPDRAELLVKMEFLRSKSIYKLYLKFRNY